MSEDCLLLAYPVLSQRGDNEFGKEVVIFLLFWLAAPCMRWPLVFFFFTEKEKVCALLQADICPDVTPACVHPQPEVTEAPGEKML